MDKPLKILLVVTLSEMGGAQKVVYHLAAGLDPGEFDVTVACAPGGELVRWLRKLDRSSSTPGETASIQRRPVRVVEIPELKREISPARDFLAFWRLYRLIGRERFDVVHCNSTKAGILGRLAAWLAGAPRVIFTAHGWGVNEYRGRLFRAFTILAEKIAGAASARVVCVSRYDCKKALALKLVRPEKLMVIYNGTPEPPDRTCRLRAELGLNGSDLLAGTVMRLAPPKEPLLFLEVARRLVEGESGKPAGAGKESKCAPVKGPGDLSGKKAPAEPSGESIQPRGVYFIIIGDGPLRGECEAFIRRHGLAGRVFLLGSREDAADLAGDFDVFTLFSRWEGLPLTIIEAMRAGAPVVANAAGGVPELVVDGETGFLIEGLDPGAAAGACGRLLGDAALRRAMGEAGRQRARELFSLEEMLRRYRELYLDLENK